MSDPNPSLPLERALLRLTLSPPFRDSRPPERRVDGRLVAQGLQLGRRQGGPAGGLGGGGDGLVGLEGREMRRG